MSMTMVNTAVLIAVATSGSTSGTGSACNDLSQYGQVCLIIFLLMLMAGCAALWIALTRDYCSKWADRWIWIAFTFLIGSMVPIFAGMIHDC